MARIELSDMIVGLRKELLEAQKKAEKEDLRFKVDSVEITAQVTVSDAASGELGGKCRFWIFSEVEAKAGVNFAQETVQTICLKLTPEHNGGALEVTGEGERPE